MASVGPPASNASHTQKNIGRCFIKINYEKGFLMHAKYQTNEARDFVFTAENHFEKAHGLMCIGCTCMSNCFALWKSNVTKAFEHAAAYGNSGHKQQAVLCKDTHYIPRHHNICTLSYRPCFCMHTPQTCKGVFHSIQVLSDTIYMHTYNHTQGILKAHKCLQVRQPPSLRRLCDMPCRSIQHAL